MKRYTTLFFTLLLTMLLPLACCIDTGEWDLAALHIRFISNDGIPATDTIQTDTLNVEILTEMFIVSAAPASISSGNFGQLYAFQRCSEDLRTEYTSILITSDRDYNNIPAGDPLNDLFFVRGEEPLSVDLIPEMYLQKGQSNEYFDLPWLTTFTKPAIPRHVFSVSFFDEDGFEVRGVSDTIVWL